MKFDIKDKKKNPLMKRDEAIVSIDHAGKATPNRLLVLSEIAKLVKNKPENIIINRITTPGGSTVSEVKAFSYSKKNDIPEWRLKKMEQRASKKKDKEEPKPSSEDKPAPEGEPKPEGEAAQESAQEKPEQEESKESGQAGEKPEEASQEGEKPAEEKKEEKPSEDAGKPAESPEEGKPSPEDKEKKEGS
ncbi:MAG: hypothetical protein KAT35_02095 [Candidatus Aenigmarchaeota archaeon]|nr:hypothetical protein [Candidatus Aenigmarchaeota archaeon]